MLYLQEYLDSEIIGYLQTRFTSDYFLLCFLYKKGKENEGIISGTTDCNELARNVPECFYKKPNCDIYNYLTEFEKKHFFAYEEETNCIKYNIDFKKLIDFIISEKKEEKLSKTSIRRNKKIHLSENEKFLCLQATNNKCSYCGMDVTPTNWCFFFDEVFNNVVCCRGCFAIRKHTSFERFRYILSCKKKSLPFFKEEDIKIYEDAGFKFPKPDLMKFYIEE